jgi:endonuclease/exonuclease/phosphatase family metal-dependent hydrolase
VKLTSWNIGGRQEPWRQLLDTDADIALLQEAGPPPGDVASKVDIDDAPWRIAGVGREKVGRTAVVGLSDRVTLLRLVSAPIADARPGEIAVSRMGTLSAAVVTPPTGQPVTVISAYAAWETAHRDSGSGWIYADASAHRLISDLSVLLKAQTTHRVILAGDWNIFHGYGDNGNAYWADRYATVFDRLSALGLMFAGPQSPDGCRAGTPPNEIPPDSLNVPTRHSPGQTPGAAAHQLDFVFASRSIHKQVKIRALNLPDEWGPSDHCRVEILFGTS